MTAPEVPAAVRDLIREQVHSYEELEALLFLHARPGEDCPPEAVAAALRVPADVAAAALGELAARGLARAAAAGGGAYRFGPATPALGAAVAALAAAYGEQRLAVIRLMSNNAIERLRTGATRAFADSFLIGRKRK